MGALVSFGVNKIKLIEQQKFARKPQSFPLISCSVYKTSTNPSQVACFYIRQKRHKPTVNHLRRKQSEIVSKVWYVDVFFNLISEG